MKALALLVISLSLAGCYTAPVNPPPKVVVVDKDGKPVKDAKGNVKQNCKEMKVHKKLEGTEIPPKK